MSNLRHGRDCATDLCDYCQNLAEERAYDWGDDSDTRGSERQYEAYLERLGEGA